MNPYNYETNMSNVKSSLIENTRKVLHYEIQFPSALDTGYLENSIVNGEYYRPKVKRKTPLVILVHGVGDSSIIPCKIIARRLVKHGIASFVPYLTIHSRRIPKELHNHMPYLTPNEWFQSY